MRVFVSWSGEKSRQLAEIFSRWLGATIQAVEPYFSPDDIAKGSRWSGEIARELEKSQVGLLCLTSENLEAPWIMFEAGALSKSLNRGRVCPILFGVAPTDLSGPLAQFQSAVFQQAEIKRVVEMINQELGDSALKEDVLDEVFEMWWPRLEREVERCLQEPDEVQSSELRSERELLEEILGLLRTEAAEPRDRGPMTALLQDYLNLSPRSYPTALSPSEVGVLTADLQALRIENRLLRERLDELVAREGTRTSTVSES